MFLHWVFEDSIVLRMFASIGNIQRRYALGLLAAMLSAPALPLFAENTRDLQSAVVKVYIVQQREDYTLPWQGGPMANATGSGFYIKGKRILTNAHVVSDVRYLQVRKQGDPTLYPAKVEFIAHDCDLATLTVDNPAFFNGMIPARFASELPGVDDEVIVLGYPMGGTRLSLTRGVVSRLDYSSYSHSGIDQHLVLQVDAAINPGNSGGPVMFKGRVVGLAFQGLSSGDNIGYAIPLPVVQRFLKDIEDGTYNGFPELGVSHTESRNPALRQWLAIPSGAGGVVVSHVDPFGSALGLLKAGDTLLAIDGHAIAEDGTILLDGNNVMMEELLERKQWGDKVHFLVWRDRMETEIPVPLRNPADPFAFRNLYDKRPTYLIKAGLVFVPLNRELLRAHERNQADPAVQQLFYYSEYAKTDNLYSNRTEFVVLMRRLPHAINTYADPFLNGIVEEVNGFPVANLAGLREALSKPQNGFHIIRFAGLKNVLVLDAALSERADAQILRMYDVKEPAYLEGKP
jgi:S1-C subfamily serine protease